jgi:hypothetical protein
VTRPHSTNELNEKTAPVLTSIRQYQVTLPHLRVTAVAACQRPRLASRQLHGHSQKNVISISYEVQAVPSHRPEPRIRRRIDIGNIILIEMHGYDTDFRRKGVVAIPSYKQTNQARCRAMVTSVVADSSARLE